MQTWTEKLEFIVSVIGDQRLNRRQVAARVKKELSNVAGQTVYNWLIRAWKKGLLGRIGVPKAGGGLEHRYFKRDGASPSFDEQSDKKSFVVQVFCPACGHDRRIECDNAQVLQTMYGRMSWSCHGCGDYVRLYDCIDADELLKLYMMRLDAQNPDLDLRLPPVCIMV